MKRSRSSLLFALLSLVAVFGSVPASAQPAVAPRAEERTRASEQFRLGREAFLRRDFHAAGRSFDDAFALSPHHDALWNAAQSWESAGEIARAANRYAAYLRLAPSNAADRAQATEALARLSKRLARVRVFASVAEPPRVDGEVVTADVFYVYPGTHVVTLERQQREISVNAQEDKSVSFGAESSSSDRLEPVGPPAPPATQQMSAKEPAPPSDDRGVRVLPPWVVLVGGGLTLAGGAATTFFGLRSADAKSDFDRSPSADLLDSGRDDQTRTNIALGATIGLAALTTCAALLFVDWRSPSRTTSASR